MLPEILLFSKDSSELIIVCINGQSPGDEQHARRMLKKFPNWSYDNMHTYAVNWIVKNNQIPDFKDSDIKYYNKKQLKRLNAEGGCEYDFRLAEAHLGKYRFGRFRYYQIKYMAGIPIYHLVTKESILRDKRRMKKTFDVIKFN